MHPSDAAAATGPAVCSARGCRRTAVAGLLWNNPALHDPGRRKVWTACAQHTESLSGFLRSRGFLRAVVPVEDLPAALEIGDRQEDSPT